MEELSVTEGCRLLFAKSIQPTGEAESIEPPVLLLQKGTPSSPGPGDGQSVVVSSTVRHRRRKPLSPSERKNRGVVFCKTLGCVERFGSGSVIRESSRSQSMIFSLRIGSQQTFLDDSDGAVLCPT